MAKTDTSQATNSTHSTAAVPVEDDDVLRKRLLSRIAVAGVVIAGLLGGLAVYDSLNKPQASALPKMAAAPAESAEPAKVAEEPRSAEEKIADDKPAETGEKVAADASLDKPVDERLAKAEAPVVPERTDTPLAPSPEKSLKAAKPLTPPASARQAMVKPGPSAAAAAKPDVPREMARSVPERTAPTHAPPSRPLTQAAESARRFLLQVGVFSNHANAEELMTRLQQAGIPAQIESRVQVGPFASRQEVDATRAKLKSLGIDDGMLVRR